MYTYNIAAAKDKNSKFIFFSGKKKTLPRNNKRKTRRKRPRRRIA